MGEFNLQAQPVCFSATPAKAGVQRLLRFWNAKALDSRYDEKHSRYAPCFSIVLEWRPGHKSRKFKRIWDMNHFEKLIRQYYDWQGYLVKGNIKVSPLPKGGYASELDVVAYHPQKNILIQIEPSLDASSWQRRTERYRKKFDFGKKHIYKDVFPWLDKSKTPLQQVAIFFNAPRKSRRAEVWPLDAEVWTIDEFIKTVKNEIAKEGRVGRNAISEEYDLLRTMQFTLSGYGYRPSANTG